MHGVCGVRTLAARKYWPAVWGGGEGYDKGGCQGDRVKIPGNGKGTGGLDVSDRYSAKSAGRTETARLCVSTVGPS